MIEILLIIIFIVQILMILLIIFLRQRNQIEELRNIITNENQKIDKLIRDEFGRNREENRISLKENREELSQTLKRNEERIDLLTRTLDEKMTNLRKELVDSFKQNRDDLALNLKNFEQSFGNKIRDFTDAQTKSFMTLYNQEEVSKKDIENKLEKIRETVEKKLENIQKDNNEKLERMRETVDEKLHKTLETRLTQSFETVTKQLLVVQEGLTQMQSLANDVGGLKKALTNVKSRGVLGEAQLGALLEQFLTKEQYGTNVKVKPKSNENVEFAVKLPGSDEKGHIWLPVDSKFPIEDYQRLIDSYERGEKEEIEANSKALENRLILQAKNIKDKYIDPPYTTDFALMFLPFEGLYAEALRRPGLFEKLQKDHRVTIVGPTTLTAFLNSLQIGFKTLAISKQSSEVWKVLGAVKTEFTKFGESLGAVQKNLETASNKLGEVSNRARIMEKKLDKVTALPEDESVKLLDNIKED